jgi:hypothetical protein
MDFHGQGPAVCVLGRSDDLLCSFEPSPSRSNEPAQELLVVAGWHRIRDLQYQANVVHNLAHSDIDEFESTKCGAQQQEMAWPRQFHDTANWMPE